MTRLRILAATFFVAAIGCSTDRNAGNSSETENTMAARVVSVDSVLPEWNRPTRVPTVITLRLDASNFDFSLADSAGSDVDVETMDGIQMPFETTFWDKPGTRARLRVRLDTMLLGKHASFLVRWNQLPKIRTNSTAVWAGIPDSQKLALTSVLVDDFEHGSMTNLLSVGKTWYSGSSDSGKINWFTLGAAGGKRTGNALGIGYSANTVQGQWVLMGTALGSGPRNLRSLDSIVFMSRGSGAFYPSLDHYVNQRGFKARAKVVIDSTWRRIRVRPSDFDTVANASGNVGWMKVRDSITHLTFMISGGSELWIDDVRLHGIDRDDLR